MPAGIDAHVVFLHEMNLSKNGLAYDLQEPFRFLVNLAVINLTEINGLDKNDFIRTECYFLKLRPSGAKKLTEAVNSCFNSHLRERLDQWEKLVAND